LVLVFGAGSENRPCSYKDFLPHSDNCPGFQKLKENLVKRFSGSAVLKEF